MTRLLGNHLLGNDSPCRVIAEPSVVPRARAAHNVRVPDLAVTCSPPSEGRMVGDPVLVVEIRSPSNADETWANVWTYTTIPSVREVLIVSSTAVGADLLRRLPDGSWPAEPTPVERGDTLRLDSIGLSLGLASLYRTSTFR